MTADHDKSLCLREVGWRRCIDDWNIQLKAVSDAKEAWGGTIDGTCSHCGCPCDCMDTDPGIIWLHRYYWSRPMPFASFADFCTEYYKPCVPCI